MDRKDLQIYYIMLTSKEVSESQKEAIRRKILQENQPNSQTYYSSSSSCSSSSYTSTIQLSDVPRIHGFTGK